MYCLLAAAVAAMLALSQEPRSRYLAFNSFRLATAAVLVSLPIGTLLALLLCRGRVWGKTWVAALLFGWMLVPLYVQTAAWQSAWAAVAGTALTGWSGAIWVHGLAAVPWVTAIQALGLLRGAAAGEEAAQLDGTSWQVLTFITLRTAIGWSVVSALWVAVATTAEIGVTDLMQVRTFAEEVLDPFKFHQPRPELWSSIVLCCLATVAAAAVAWWLTPPLVTVNRGEALTAPRLGGQFGVSWAVWGMVLLLTLPPLSVLLYQTGVTVESTPTGFARGWSWGAAVQLVAGTLGRHSRELGWSLLIASVAATTAMTVGAAAAWWAREGGWRAWLVGLTGAFCLALPGPMLGVLLIRLLNRPEYPLLLVLYDRSILAPVLAQTIRTLPLCLLVLGPLWAADSRQLHDAARCDGAGALTRFWELGVRAHRVPLWCGWAVGFAWSVGELSATILVLPPGMDTLPRRTFGLIHSGVQDHVAALCLWQIAALGLPLVIIVGLIRRRRGWGRARPPRLSGQSAG